MRRRRGARKRRADILPCGRSSGYDAPVGGHARAGRRAAAATNRESMKNKRGIASFAGVILSVMLLMSSGVHAQSRLERFEDDATRARSSSPTTGNKHPRKSEDSRSRAAGDDSDSWLGDIVTDLVVGGGVNSWLRVAASPEEQKDKEVLPRTPGEGLLVHARLDAAYHWVAQQTHASDLRGEVGYGPFGAEGRETRYVDDAPERVSNCGSSTCFIGCRWGAFSRSTWATAGWS